MRGSLTIEQAFQLNAEDRNLMITVINQNIESLQKAGIPAY